MLLSLTRGKETKAMMAAKKEDRESMHEYFDE